MLKITNVTIKNFLSVGNVTQAVPLSDNGLTLVLGSNTDSNGGVTRNGAGKSTILQAISFALFGKPLTKIKIPNLINNINAKGMIVSIEFEDDGVSYKIERGKKPDVMKFYKNSEEQKLETDETQGENKHTQHEIERIIGMSHTMFKHIVALNTFTDPFLKLGAADQRAIIEELLGVTQISQRAKTLSELIKMTKDAIRGHEAKIKATIDVNESINNAIRQAELKAQTWDNAHAAKLEGMAEELATVESINFEDEIAVFDRIDAHDTTKRELESEQATINREIAFLSEQRAGSQKSLDRLNGEAQNGSATQITRLESERARRENDALRLSPKLVSLKDDLKRATDDITNADQSDCVCCGQPIVGTDHLATIMVSLEAKRTELNAEIERVIAEIGNAHQEADAVGAEIERVKAEDESRRADIEQRIEAKAEEVIGFEAKLRDQNGVLSSVQSAIIALGDRPRSSYRSRDDVYRVRSERETIERAIEHEMSLSNPHTAHVEDYRKTLQPLDYDPLNDATDLLKHQDFLLKLLTNKDSFIRKKIIDQNLAYLNSRLNHYLDKLGLPHEVIFQSDLSVDITMLGRDFDFEQLSRGEMNRVIMATSWSFRDVWESQNNAINLFWIDELLDNGLDTHGVETALGILKSMARDRGKNVFLISHRDELQARIDRTLLVRKDNGFTTFEADAS